MRLYQKARQEQSGFEDGVRAALQGILADPNFVYRFERPPSGVRSGSNYRVSDLELASRLSYFLWSSGPDEALIDLATPRKIEGACGSGTAGPPNARRRPVGGVGGELCVAVAAPPESSRPAPGSCTPFPTDDLNLMKSMERETELFFMSFVRDDRPVMEMLTADYTFVDGRLARHYRIPNVVGNRFRRVAVTDESRKGLLGHASILTVTSFPTRTSPVVRGKWMLDNLLGAPPPQPPPDVPPLKENTEEEKPLPLRARLQEHRTNPTCAACHATMDPIGFALENFDALGVARRTTAASAIDPSGQLLDGTKLDGPVGLRHVLVDQCSELFKRTFTEKLLTYALGRGVGTRHARRAIDCARADQPMAVSQRSFSES